MRTAQQGCCPIEDGEQPYLYNDEDDTEDGEQSESATVGENGEEIDTDEDPSNAELQQLKSLVEENGEDMLYPPLDGTAFYLTLCKINHSCEPNVVVKYTSKPSGGLVAQLFAVRDIFPGEELLQSYIDNSLRKCNYFSYIMIVSCGGAAEKLARIRIPMRLS